MGKYKTFVAGVIVGGIVVSASSALAASGVIATLAPWIKFEFNGQEKKWEQGESAIIYKDRTYVSARFIAEELGAEVKWNDKSNTVSINYKEPEKPQPQPQPEQPKPEQPQINYEALPVAETKNGVTVEVYGISQEDEYVKYFVRLKNTTSHPMKLDQESVVLKANNEEYKASGVVDLLRGKDSTWYRDIREDEKAEGFVAVQKFPSEVKEGKIKLSVIQNDGTQAKTDFEFNIKW